MCQGSSRSAGPLLLGVLVLLLQVCRRIPIVRCSFDRAPPHQGLVDEIFHHVLKCGISLELFGGWSSDAALRGYALDN